MPVPVITVAQMREWEKVTWSSGVTEDAVMRNAGAAVARCAERMTGEGDFVLFLGVSFVGLGIFNGLSTWIEDIVRPRGFSLLALDETDSTNDEAARQLAAGRTAPFAVFAHRQTKGRGRLGRAWHSESNGNLYLSVAFRPRVPPERMGAFTLWMGLNVCELLANFAKVTPGLKWPNDILFDGKKAGGILTEARIDADEIRDLVFGLGLNLNGRGADLPRDLQKTAISLADATGAPLDLNRFAAALIGRVLTAYDQFLEGGYRDKFAALWKRYDVLRGRPVSVTQGTRTVTGTVTGIDNEGSLIVRLNSGRSERFRAGEVTLSREAAPAV